MASVRIRTETNKLYIDFRYLGIRCREQSNLTNTTKNFKQLKKMAKTIEAEIVLDEFDYSKTFPYSRLLPKIHKKTFNQTIHILSFEQFITQWLKHKKPEWKQSYYKSIRSIISTHLLPKFGGKTIDQISRSDILDFRASLAESPSISYAEKLSASRVNHIISPLLMILDDAAIQYATHSQTRGIKSLRIPRTKVLPFTLSEVKLIIDSVRPDFKNYYVVRFFTGLRTGEIDGLKWRYIDFDKRQILIYESLVGGQTVYTKNDISFRSVDMTQTVYDALMDQYGISGKGEYVFCSRKGTPLNHNNVTNRVWHPLLKELGLTPRRPYITRHTAATLWLACGESAEWIAKQLGHSTTELLFKTYSRFVPNLTHQDGSAFENLLNQKYHER